MTTVSPVGKSQGRGASSVPHSPSSYAKAPPGRPSLRSVYPNDPERPEQALELGLKRRKLNNLDIPSHARATASSVWSNDSLRSLVAPQRFKFQRNDHHGTLPLRRERRPPLYPPRPTKTSSDNGASRISNQALGYLSLRGSVSVKAYAVEAPSSTPRYQNTGKDASYC